MAAAAIDSIIERRQSTSSAYFQPEIAVLYITERILVLSFPAISKRTDEAITASDEAAYRSSLRHVSRMLRTKHGDSYKIFNLSRRRRDLCQYNQYVVEFGWPVNQAPPLERLCALCKDMDGWLNRDAQNIAILHEKPGANRAAMAVAVFMHYCSISASDDQALDRFAMRKFYNEHKVQPSQKRYVNYFSGLLSGQIKINSYPIYLYQIVIYGLPVGCRPYLKFYEKMVPVLTTGAYKIQNPVLTARLQPPLALRGDVLVKCCDTIALSSYAVRSSSTSLDWQQRRPILLFTCQFNTCAVDLRGAPCFSFSARDLDLTTNEEAGLDLLYSFEKDFRPVGELATLVGEDTAATLAYRSNSYDRFDRLAEDDTPSAPPQQSEPDWTGHSLLDSSSSTSSQQPRTIPDRSSYRSPPQRQQAPLVRQSSANDTADSGIHSVVDGDSSGVGPINLENVVVESQARRAELIDHKLLAKDSHRKQPAMENSMDATDVDRIVESAASYDRNVALAGIQHERNLDAKTPNGPLTSPPAEYGNRPGHTLPKEVSGAQIEFPHRPPPLTAPSRRPFSPQQRPVSPVSLGGVSNLTQDGKEIDAELVEEGRYDPQSKAFSYVPAKSLEDHFKAPRQQTKLVLKTERPQGAESTAPSAPLPITDNDLADLETATNATQFEPRQIEKRGRQQQQAPPASVPQRKRSTSRSRTPLTTEEFDQLLNPDFYLNFQGEQPSSMQQPVESSWAPKQPPATPRKQPQPPPKSQFTNGGATSDALPADDLTVFDDLIAYGMAQSGQPAVSESPMKPAGKTTAPASGWSSSAAPLDNWQEYQKPLTIVNKVPPHLDTRRGWSPPKRAPGTYKDDDVRWDQVFDDFEKKFIKYPESKPRQAATPPSAIYSTSAPNQSQRPWTTAPPTPVLSTRYQHQQPARPYDRPLAESVIRALGPNFVDDSSAPSHKPMASLPIRPSTAMGFQANDDDEIGVQRATPSRYNYASVRPDAVRKTRSIPDDYGTDYYSDSPTYRPRTQSSGSDADWLSRQMEKLRQRKESNDPVLRQRREQERQLLDELRNVNEDKMIKRSRLEADYTVEGVGVRAVEPGSEEDVWEKQMQLQQLQQLQQQQQPSQVQPQHQMPQHLLYRPRTEQHAPPPETRPRPQQQPQPQPMSYAEHVTAGALEPGTILLRREVITNPSESPFLAQQFPGARPKTPTSYSQARPYEQQPAALYNGGNTRPQSRPDKPFDFHRLQEVLWDSENMAQQPLPQQSSAAQVSTRTVSSPRSILKKPKPSSMDTQHYASTAPVRPYAKRPSSPYSLNGFHDVADSPASRVYELEPAEIEPAEPAPIAPQGYRPDTPAFPMHLRGETPLPYHPYLYSGAELEPRSPPVARAYSSGYAGMRSPSPASQYYGQSRRSSMTSLLEPMDVVHHHPVFVKDTSKYWYKPHISREEAIAILKDKPPGTFIIRDSNSFPGAFGLALKVATPPPGVQTKTNDGSELVRHFLIEPTAKGVKLKGCNNEPIFGSLAALVYQHSTTPLALPSKLVLPEYDPAAASDQIGSAQALLEQGAACNVTYLHSCDTESLTGPEAVRRAVDQALFAAQQKQLTPVSVHFKVSTQGITVTDNTRKLFFRRHYPVNSVTFCGLDPEERRWTVSGSVPVRIFGFVARKIANRTENACHIFAELEPEQPATAIVNFITKVMMAPIQHQQQ